MTKDKNRSNNGSKKIFFKNKRIQRIFIAVVTIILAFLMVLNGATPRKYRVLLGAVSGYDILSPRDIVNTIKTEENARKAASEVLPVIKEIPNAPIEVINSIDKLFLLINEAQKSYESGISSIDAYSGSRRYEELSSNVFNETKAVFVEGIGELGIKLEDAQIDYLISKANEEDIKSFEVLIRSHVSDIMRKDITEDNLKEMVNELKDGIFNSEIKYELKNVALSVSDFILKPNRAIDNELTKTKRTAAYNDPGNVETIKKGQRILSAGDIVTEDKLRVLEDLNLLETKSRFDFSFAGGILVILLLLSLLLILYMHNFCKKVYYNRSDLILLSVVILMMLFIARWVHEYSPLIIPIFIATMLISILLDLRLAIVVNVVLTMAISLMINYDFKFIYMALISGTFSAFIVSKANQRNRLSLAGTVVSVINVLLVAAIDIIYKSGWETVLRECTLVFVNGIMSMVITIGLLPFLESTFNIITPLRLLEFANPNQPLLKRLLMEAPGTYHHSLMVGNLAEAGTEAIGGNALLARVGAYFHDIGKLKRPNFFIENQMNGNPHDKMTANLSALVITSHIHDGNEMAKKHKIPLPIRDIILQHHGTTLVAYFYHKAKMAEKSENVEEENFRYDGIKPTTKEAAVVMMADSVEAAVRSMTDKTEGKIEGLIRKIIKDKLDDGQLDHCSLTLKDLDNIAKAFMKVFSGVFHAREEYPEVRRKADAIEDIHSEDMSERENLASQSLE
ncbi:HD family phosphohydrolase [Acetivibrio mesophilus]|uniref:HDIG domain-containing protein n=1 Tax=Acetivibrio mesophilus TaxID=2487273 RepID=A0A4Q0I696_9FIRM|nr:HDIG domain-containing metalloprotein [Acetivibrio mesophilus]RXE59906.1 HDIG domain-containing protein [Acetivibrio mesophilus]